MESDELSFSPVHSGQDFYFDDPDESKEGVKLEPRKPGEGFSGHAPPGTWAELAHGTHVPRLLSDHLRHLVMVAYGSVDVYEKNEMA